MNKKEEEFLEEFVKYKGELYKRSSGNVIIKIEKEDLKNWITEHDKRERERLIEEMFSKLKNFDENLKVINKTVDEELRFLRIFEFIVKIIDKDYIFKNNNQ